MWKIEILIYGLNETNKCKHFTQKIQAHERRYIQNQSIVDFTDFLT